MKSKNCRFKGEKMNLDEASFLFTIGSAVLGLLVWVIKIKVTQDVHNDKLKVLFELVNRMMDKLSGK